MTRAFAFMFLAALLSMAAFSQSTGASPAGAPPAFEVADVHASADAANPFPYMKGPFVRGGRYEVRSATMADLIATAYGVTADKVVSGPSWLEMDRFDAIAKIPADSTPETREAMLQALLADRFNLVVHKDTRPLPAYALTAGKHPALKKADGSGETGCKFTRPTPDRPAGGPAPMPTFLYSCRNMTMAAFAEGLRNMAAAFLYIGDNLVADQTGLEGSWDFDFKYTQRGRSAAAAADTVTIFDALDKQLGLKLEPAQVPMAVIVVDNVNRKPTGNLPGVTERLQVAPAPTEFDVAAVKPTDPDYRGMNFQIQPGGRVNLQGVTLKFLIDQAWNLTDDMLVGAPKWMDTDRFDIVAKASSAVFATGPSSGPSMDIDIDAVFLMVRALLADRFKLATHMEDRPVPAYTLVAVKPKMKRADPSSRTLFKEGPATLDAKDPRNANPALARLVTCQNMTMAQFAEKLQSIAPGYIHSPVLDATGIDGAWDFTLSFSPAGMAQGGGGRGGDAGPPSGAAVEASEPGTGLTLLEAVEKQLGLKLVMQKRSIPVLVIDHVEQKPDN
jgi:uncharacterized protein (TIGR03435 family)